MENTKTRGVNMIKRLTAKRIGQWVLDNLQDGQTIEFALTEQEKDKYTDWWFMRWVNFPEYNSRALYIDYCGGGYAFVAAFDGEEESFCEILQEYFEHLDGYNELDKINLEIKRR